MNVFSALYLTSVLGGCRSLVAAFIGVYILITDVHLLKKKKKKMENFICKLLETDIIIK